MKRYTFIILLALGICFSLTSHAQTLSRSVIGATCSTSEQLSYTIGETVIQTGSSSSETLTQGFQQPDKIVGTFTDPAFGEANFVLYPNPTSGKLKLEITSRRSFSMLVQFSDIRGRLLSPAQKLEVRQGTEAQFDVSEFASGPYLLLLKDENEGLLRGIRFVKVD